MLGNYQDYPPRSLERYNITLAYVVSELRPTMVLATKWADRMAALSVLVSWLLYSREEYPIPLLMTIVSSCVASYWCTSYWCTKSLFFFFKLAKIGIEGRLIICEKQLKKQEQTTIQNQNNIKNDELQGLDVQDDLENISAYYGYLAKHSYYGRLRLWWYGNVR